MPDDRWPVGECGTRQLPAPGFGTPVFLFFGTGAEPEIPPVAEGAPLSDIVEWMHGALSALASQVGWATEPLAAARDHARERVETGILDSIRKRSPDHRKYATLTWRFDPAGTTNLNITITDRNGRELSTKSSALPAPFIFQTNDWRTARRNFRWSSSDRVGTSGMYRPNGPAFEVAISCSHDPREGAPGES